MSSSGAWTIFVTPDDFRLVSEMAPRFALYYNVTEDVYVMNDPEGGTLFKRRNAAAAVKALLGSIE